MNYQRVMGKQALLTEIEHTLAMTGETIEEVNEARSEAVMQAIRDIFPSLSPA